MNEVNTLFSVLLGAAIVALLVGLFLVALFISVVWTHRPDLSVRDILHEAVREIKNK